MTNVRSDDHEGGVRRLALAEELPPAGRSEASIHRAARAAAVWAEPESRAAPRGKLAES